MSGMISMSGRNTNARKRNSTKADINTRTITRIISTSITKSSLGVRRGPIRGWSGSLPRLIDQLLLDFQAVVGSVHGGVLGCCRGLPFP